MFPENISLQFEEEGVTEFVDQDSLLQVAQRRSNRLLVISDTTATEETALSETDSSDDPLQEYPLLHWFDSGYVHIVTTFITHWKYMYPDVLCSKLPCLPYG